MGTHATLCGRIGRCRSGLEDSAAPEEWGRSRKKRFELAAMSDEMGLARDVAPFLSFYAYSQSGTCIVYLSTRLAQIMQISPERLAQRPLRKPDPQPLPLRCAAHRANRVGFRFWEGGKPEQWPSHPLC